jgi:hypothetical protein
MPDYDRSYRFNTTRDPYSADDTDLYTESDVEYGECTSKKDNAILEWQPEHRAYPNNVNFDNPCWIPSAIGRN